MGARCLMVAGLMMVLVSDLSAQNSQTKENDGAASFNPPGLLFVLKTKDGGRKTFHLGEMIEIEEDYSSTIPERYLLLENPEAIEGGASPHLKITPGEKVVDRIRDTGRVSAAPILQARCQGLGIGGAASGICGDCGGSLKLGREAIHFPYVLNYRFAITEPGRYTIQASAANIVVAGSERKAIPVVSTSLEIQVVRDAAWSHKELQTAVENFEEARREYRLNGWDVTDPWSEGPTEKYTTAQEVESAAEIIRFLDTEESLSEAVRLYDGSSRVATYENGFLNAIVESSHRDLAVRLLAKRILDENFEATGGFVDLLTAMTIQVEEPTVFAQGDLASWKQLNPRALEILREYVLALGESLPSKRFGARELGIATFEQYASKDFCTGQPLIEKGVAEKMLTKARPN